MSDAGAAETRERLHGGRRSQVPKGAPANVSGGRHAGVAYCAGREPGRGAARLSGAHAQRIALRIRYREAAA
jgi:hypothetical protein